MRFFRSYISLLFLLLVYATPVRAQDPPTATTLLRSWTSDQRSFINDYAEIEFIERAVYMLDGYRGRQRFRIETRLRGQPGRNHWEREPLSVTVNGRPVQSRHRREIERRRTTISTGPLNQLVRTNILVMPWLGQLAPEQAISVDTIDGISYWRLDLGPRESHPPVLRVTLWFDRNKRHLIRSTVLLRRPSDSTPVTVTTDYNHIDGYDLPSRRHIEGTMHTRRRRRFFTQNFDITTEYDRYRFYESR